MYSGDEHYDDDITSGQFDEAGVPTICIDWHEEEACSKLADLNDSYCECECPHCTFVRKS